MAGAPSESTGWRQVDVTLDGETQALPGDQSRQSIIFFNNHGAAVYLGLEPSVGGYWRTVLTLADGASWEVTRRDHGAIVTAGWWALSAAPLVVAPVIVEPDLYVTESFTLPSSASRRARCCPICGQRKKVSQCASKMQQSPVS